MNNFRSWTLVQVVTAVFGSSLSIWACGGGDEYWPRPLSFYEGRLPGRSLGRILLETGGIKVPDNPKDADFDIQSIIEKIGTLTSDQLVKKVDDALEHARAHHLHKSVFASLHDLRDLFAAKSVPVEAMQDYARWRVQWANDALLPNEDLSKLIKECEAGTRPMGLLPHYLYCMGAQCFHSVKDVDSERWFLRVMKDFPDHPRAETAFFMAARSALSQTRTAYGGTDEDPMKRAKAIKAFADYRQRYPQGRFIGDVLGWEGGLHFDANEYLEALRCYSQQLRFPKHPELMRSAIPMCERCLDHLCFNPTNIKGTLDVVVSDPALTTALVYHVLWTPFSENSADWRKTMLRAIAEALPAAEKSFAGEVWQPRFLSILAQSLSGDGHQLEALDMLNRNATAGAAIEEWCFARAVVLERSDRFKESLAAYDDFIQRFPKSTWITDAQRRRAGVFKDMGEADRAVLAVIHEDVTKQNDSGMIYPESDKSLEVTDSALAYSLSLCDNENRAQTLEALFYGAPVEQLARLGQAGDFDAADQKALKEHLARRLIAQHRYGDAAALLPPDLVKRMGLRELAGKPDAATYLRLAKSWASARGKWVSVFLPSKDDDSENAAKISIVPSAPLIHDPHWGLRDSIRALHFPESDEVMPYDELAHALEFCRKVIAKSSAKEKTGAEARLFALDAMPVLARSNSHMLALAQRNDWSGESHRWWYELQKVRGKQVNVSRAVYWSFGDPELDPVLSEVRSAGDEYRDRRRANSYWARDPDFIFNDCGALGDGEENYGFGAEGKSRIGIAYGSGKKNLLDEIAALRVTALEGDVTKLRTVSSELQKRVQAAHPLVNEAFVLNALNDLCAAVDVAAAPEQARCDYAAFRILCLGNAAWGGWNLTGHGLTRVPDGELLEQLADHRNNPKNASLSDFLDALEISLEANHGVNRDWVKVEKLCLKFLIKYPRSTKREAVSVHLVRAAYRARRPLKAEALDRWASLGLDAIDKTDTTAQLPWSPKHALAAIANYRREFQHGVLSAEVDDIEGLTAWRKRDYEKALQIAAKGLGKDNDRHVFSVALFVNACADLEKPESRAAVIAALRKTTSTDVALKTYLEAAESKSGEYPLSFMGAFLREQVLKR